MRKALTCAFALAVSLGTLSAAPPAHADSCRGDLYCDAPKPPKRCNQGGIIICSAGDALMKDYP